MSYNDFQRKNHIRELQGYLYSISLFNKNITGVVPDGIYGSETYNSVKNFQKEYNLSQTGQVNYATWNKIVEVYKYYTQNNIVSVDVFTAARLPLKVGSSGYEVYIMQVMLYALSQKYSNLPSPEINGTFDRLSFEAVKKFQEVSKLPRSGNFDKATANMLAADFSNLITG